MTQRNGPGVRHDVVTEFVDGVLRAAVVLLLLAGYLTWLGRSPAPALALGVVVAVLVRAWYRTPWVFDRRHDAAGTDVDLMTCREFQALVAALMRRDRFQDVRPLGLQDDSSTDVTARTPAGHRVVVQCHREAPRRKVGSPDVARFLTTADDAHAADLAVVVTTGRFTRSATALGARPGVVLLDRSQLTAWMSGRATELTPYLTETVS